MPRSNENFRGMDMDFPSNGFSFDMMCWFSSAAREDGSRFVMMTLSRAARVAPDYGYKPSRSHGNAGRPHLLCVIHEWLRHDNEERPHANSSWASRCAAQQTRATD